LPIIQKDDLKGITTTSQYGNTIIYRLNEKNIIDTEYGKLIPAYTEDDARRKYNGSISCSNNGHLHSISLESMTDIMTPIGPVPAEHMIFYDTGEIKRIFPVNGKISGYWSEQDERRLCPLLKICHPLTTFKSRIINLTFYRSGNIKSITLWPNERIYVRSPVGKILVKNGFSLYENGTLRSLEPAKPVDLETPIGLIVAFDTTAIGINADNSSVTFDNTGKIASLKTDSIRVTISTDSSVTSISPKMERSMTSDDEWIVMPINIRFTPDGIMFDECGPYDMKSNRFSIEIYNNPTIVHGHPIIPE
jgi:hypothetical protein